MLVKTKLKIIGLTVGIAIVAFLGFEKASRSRIPVYQGTPLTFWLNELSPVSEETQVRKAQQAIRAIGTNAVPLLLKYLSKRDNRRVEAIKIWWCNFTKKPVAPAAIFLRNDAVAGFRALGPLGHGAIPQLQKIMTDEELAYDAARALGAMNAPGSYPLFCDYLNSPEPGKRSAAAAGLGEMGVAARDCVPKLRLVLKADREEAVRGDAVGALVRIGPEDAVLPNLIEALENDKSELVRICAVIGFRQFQDSQVALEALRRVGLNDNSQKVRRLAAYTLGKAAETRMEYWEYCNLIAL